MKKETKNLVAWCMQSYGKLAIGIILSGAGTILALNGAHAAGGQEAVLGMYATDPDATQKTLDMFVENTNQ